MGTVGDGGVCVVVGVGGVALYFLKCGIKLIELFEALLLPPRKTIILQTLSSVLVGIYCRITTRRAQLFTIVEICCQTETFDPKVSQKDNDGCYKQ